MKETANEQFDTATGHEITIDEIIEGQAEKERVKGRKEERTASTSNHMPYNRLQTTCFEARQYSSNFKPNAPKTTSIASTSNQMPPNQPV